MSISVGDRIGRGKVIEYLGIQKTGFKNHGRDQTARFWMLKCECGKIYKSKTGLLNNGSVKSCGCLRRSNRDEVGNKYGFLTVIKKLAVSQKNNNPNTKNQMWKLKCICGKEIERPTSQLKVIRSCGCKNRVVFKATTCVKYFQELKKAADKRGIKFSLDQDGIKNLLANQNFKCALTGRQISIEDGTASLDRINSKEGYEVKNIQWVHREINILKNSWDNQKFIDICEEVSKFSRQRLDKL